MTRLLAIVLLLSCGKHLTDAQREEALKQSLAAIDPNAEPAPPKPPPADGVQELNTEYWLGDSQEAEEALVQDFGKQIQSLQEKMASDRGNTEKLRGFHAKSHGCLHGELQPVADRPARTKWGIFADGVGPLPVWVRYSNAVGWKQADDKLDARGMAIKVMNVPGPKYLDDEKSTQDFLMTNSPIPVGADAQEFMKFAHANAKGNLFGVFFLLGHPRSGKALTKTSAIDSSISEPYYSGGPFHLGAHQATKFLAKPCPGVPARKPSRDSDDYLKQDLIAGAKDGLCYTLYYQFQVSAEDTPVENASVIWEEELTPPIAVANIVMPPQELAAQDFCDGLVFNPWHAITPHKPMGSHNRARKIVYASSVKMRAHGMEPTPWTAETAVDLKP